MQAKAQQQICYIQSIVSFIFKVIWFYYLGCITARSLEPAMLPIVNANWKMGATMNIVSISNPVSNCLKYEQTYT